MLTTVAKADSADIDAAVFATRRAFEAPTWSGISPHARAHLLLKIADAVERHAQELAYLETLDMGAPLSDNMGRAAQVADIFRYYAGGPRRSAAPLIRRTPRASSTCCANTNSTATGWALSTAA